MARVLIVDDDEGIRESLRYALEDAGHVVKEAADGLAALGMLRDSRERMVVLLDLMMPKLDGAGVLGAVSGDRRLTRQYAFILMTANPRTLPLAFSQLLLSLGVPYFAKPFDVDDLLRQVGEAWARLESANPRADDTAS